MAVTSSRVTVTGGSATKLADATGTDYQSGAHVLVRNADAAITVDLGASTVASGSGFALLAGAAVTVDLQAGEELYAKQASGSPVVHVLKSGA